MKLSLHWVDAFTDRVFAGNPAAVVPLDAWIPDALMQSVAAENGLSETVFFVRETDGGEGAYAIRWFTPAAEIDLCGHATLASAHVLFTRLAPGLARVRFSSRSGPLDVERDGGRIVLDFPSLPAEPCPAPEGLAEALGREPSAVLRARALLAVFDDAAAVRALAPDMARLAAFPKVIVTAPAAPDDGCDFVSRFFAPALGVPEDPVTGSAHCTLVPYWAQRLGRTQFHARQVSRRGGELWCEDRGDRVRMGGRAVTYMTGEIDV